MSDSSVRPQTVLVTGGATGIGEGVSRAFCEQGATVVVADLDGEGLERLGESLRAAPGRVVGSLTDVTDSTAVDGLVSETVAAHGGIDVLVVAAGGYQGAKKAEEVTDDEWERVLLLNLTAAFKVARAVIPVMKDAGSGRIVMISSATGRMPTLAASSVVHYTAAKAGMIGLVKQLALELGPHGVTVNAVAPGTTWTPRVQRLRSPESFADITATIPLERIADVADQIGPIMFLASEAAAYMTGAVLDVNGGRLMF